VLKRVAKLKIFFKIGHQPRNLCCRDVAC
jgi:hypothetical protein